MHAFEGHLSAGTHDSCGQSVGDRPPGWFHSWLVSSLHEALQGLQFKNLAKSVWALSKLSVNDQPLLDACALQVLRSSANFQPHHVAMLTWSLAKLGRNDAPLLHALALRATGCVEELNARSLSNIAWEHAKLLHSEA
eukprot:Skav208602  [mRNA]  locus=scaffold598:235343:246610:+ [translate_table: standard]